MESWVHPCAVLHSCLPAFPVWDGFSVFPGTSTRILTPLSAPSALYYFQRSKSVFTHCRKNSFAGKFNPQVRITKKFEQKNYMRQMDFGTSHLGYQIDHIA